MQKNILYSILLTTFTLGLYGCSCSQVANNSLDLAPGLYLSDLSVAEGNGGGVETITLSVTLERENTEEVTVSYSISAIDPEGRTDSLAIVGASNAENVDVVAVTSETLTFSGGATKAEVSIEVNADTLYEHDEKFLVTLSGASGGVEIVKGSVEVSILNDDAAPVVTMTSSTSSLVEALVNPGDADPENATITLTLNTVSGVDAAVILSGTADPTADGFNLRTKVGETADYRSDYFIIQNDVVIQRAKRIIIAAGSTEAVVELKVIDDGIIENDEKFFLTLDAAADATVSSQLPDLEFLITDNDAPAAGFVKQSTLSDTGVLELPNLTDLLNAEADASMGLDVTLINKVGGGRVGFDYTKISSTGTAMPDDEAIVIDANTNDVTIPWECVKDNNTGLLWEVKTRGDVGVRSESRGYTWYDSNYATNGGDAGEQGNSLCLTRSSSIECNTAYYVADINYMKLCGMTGWRLPTVEELRTIIDYGVKTPSGTLGSVVNPDESPAVFDMDYFIGDTLATKYIWTSTTDVSDTARVRTIRFRTPVTEEARLKSKSVLVGIRLVNDSLQPLVQTNVAQ